MTNGVCARCSHRSTCSTPCEPIRQLLASDGQVMERPDTDEAGNPICMIYPKHRHVPFSAAFQDREADRTLSTDDIPWAHSDFKKRQTNIFVDRFFSGFSFEDLAVKYDMTVSTAQSHYYNAIERLKHNVEFLDRYINTLQIKNAVDAAGASVPNGLRWLVMFKIFGINPASICEIDGVKPSNVAMSMATASDMLAAGELELMGFSDQERAEAVERLQKKRDRQALYRARRRA